MKSRDTIGPLRGTKVDYSRARAVGPAAPLAFIVEELIDMLNQLLASPIYESIRKPSNLSKFLCVIRISLPKR